MRIFFFQAEDGIRDRSPSRGLGDVYKRQIMDGVTPGMTVGASTEALAGEGMIVTAGGIDTHIHFISPQQIDCALYSGVTTMIGGGTGPADGTNATTCTPGPWNLKMMLKAAEELSLIHISEPTRRTPISYAVFCLKKKKKTQTLYTHSLLPFI